MCCWGVWRSLFYNGGIRDLILDHMLPKSLILVCRTASVIGDMGPPTVAHFGVFLFLFGQSLCEWASPHTTHFCFLVQFCALCPKPWHLKHCWIEGVILNSSTLKIMPVFWHISPPRNKCLGLFWVVTFYFYKWQVFTCSLWLHSFCLGMGYFIEIKQLFKIFKCYVVRYSLENQNVILFCVCRVVWPWEWHFNFFPENLLQFWLTLQDGEIFGSISYENTTIFCLLDL